MRVFETALSSARVFKPKQFLRVRRRRRRLFITETTKYEQ